MATPAVKPVTAGKNTPKISCMLTPFLKGVIETVSGKKSVPIVIPAIIETSDNAMAPITKY